MTDIVYNKNGIPFDIDAIATDLNGKMDRDCLNYSDTGASVMASMAMPSNRYIDLTLGASGSTYTAPADGWFTAQIINPNQWSNFSLYNTITSLGYILVFTTNHGSADSYTLSIPVKKGDIIKANYTGTLNRLRFVYAVGSESEAS